MPNSPLKGVRVVALEQAVAGPYCSFVMAELGAEVIKVERVDGGDVIRGWDNVVSGLSSGFVWVNGGKRDIAVDIRTPAGRDIIRKLALTADVFLENFTPGALDRAGLGHQELMAENPRLIYTSLSGYGATGPYKRAKAFDLLIQGESGILLMNGSPAEPAKVALPMVDLVAGTTALVGILSALHERDTTGEGCYLDVSMLDSVALWLGYFPHYAWNDREAPPRTGMHHHSIVPYGPFRASDDRYINLVAGSDTQWSKLCADVLDRHDWISDSRFATVAARGAHRSLLQQLLTDLIGSKPAEHWISRLRDTDLPFGEVRTIEDAVQHPQLIARQMIVPADTPVGRVPTFRFGLADPGRVRQVPAMGEDTDSLLKELGYGSEQIDKLRQTGAVA